MKNKFAWALLASAAVLAWGPAPAQSQAGPLDHLMCYKVKDKLKPASTVDMFAELQPQFSQKGCVLVKPVEFCVPASKLNVQPPPPNPNITGQALKNDYVCYLAKCPRQRRPPSRTITDQFGQRLEKNFKPFTVCVPAEKTALGCGFIPGTKVCAGGCIDPTQQCHLDKTTKQCTCEPESTCGGTPDKAGVCGGTCPTDQLCLPTTTSTGKPTCECQPQTVPLCGLNSSTGTCGGSCLSSADKCVMNAAGQCTCEPASTPCAQTGVDPTGGPICGGTCPQSGQTCAVDATGACSCQPPAGCSADPTTGTCGGSCPTGQTCLWSSNGVCQCQPPPCGGVAGACAGSCELSDQKCAPDATGACNCQPAACGLTGANTCGGDCPAGSTCTFVPGLANPCLCQ